MGDRVDEVARRPAVSMPLSSVAEKSSRWPPVGDLVEDRGDLGQEAHVGHVVGLVEHGDLHVAEVDRAAVDQVGEPARGGDEDVDAPVERLDLRLVGQAAGDQLVAQAE